MIVHALIHTDKYRDGEIDIEGDGIDFLFDTKRISLNKLDGNVFD